MNQGKRIAYITSEVTPFAASGGLGDVMGALPRSIRRLTGKDVEVLVLLPLYRTMDSSFRARMKEVFRGSFSLAWRNTSFLVRALKIQGVEYLFFENAQYFDRPSLYGEFDDGERFAFFCRAVLAYLLDSGRIPDVLHCNDWQTALSIVYLRTLFREDERAAKIRTVFTVHNIDYQGKYDPAILSDVFDLNPAHLPLLSEGGCLNLLKGALMLADRVTTVSPSYAAELRDPAFGAGLSRVISSLGTRVTGILNGMDTAYFDPADAAVIPHPYTAQMLPEGKRENKRAAEAELGFSAEGEYPLFLMVTRLVEAKGIDLVMAIAEQLLAIEARLVVLGTGDGAYERFFRELEAKKCDKVRAILRFDRDL